MYETNDMYLAAYCIARGVRLDSHNRANGKTMFRLAGNNGLDEIIREYYADAGMVSGLRLFNALRNLKNLIYLNVNNHENKPSTTAGTTAR
jgi:hypothetical protein